MSTKTANTSAKIEAITQKTLVSLIQEKTGLSKINIEAILHAFPEVAQEALAQGKKIVWPRFMSLSLLHTQERTAHNPRTNAQIKVPAGIRPKAKISPSFKDGILAIKK